MVRYTLTALAVALSLSPASAQTLLAATDVLDALPPSVSLADARGVAIVPRATSPGTRPGRGVLLVKGETGWGDPTFVNLDGGAYRAAGGDAADVVLVFRTRRSLDRIVHGDRIIDSEAAAHVRTRGAFSAASLEGAKLARGNLLSFGGDRAQAATLRTKLTERAAPRLAAAPPVPVPTPGAVGWSLTVENRDAILGALAVVGSCLAAFRRWKH